MSKHNVHHIGFISSVKYDELNEWYTTTNKNEVIEFKDGDKQRYLNAMLIEAESTDLYVRILPSDYCLFIPAGSSKSYDYSRVYAIQVMNDSGAKLRWSGSYY